MTTIAASVRDGVMCSDDKWTDGETVGKVRKIFRHKGALFGFCGTWAQWDAWWSSYRTGAASFNAKDYQDLTVLRLSADGLHTWDVNTGWFPIREKFYAIGTGGPYALGALTNGATCHEAVRIACTWDTNSRGPVRTLKLLTGKPTP